MELFRDYLSKQKTEHLAQRISERFYDRLRRRVRTYKGLDGVTSSQFTRRPKTMVRKVIAKMLKRGRNRSGVISESRFTFTPFRRFEIPKSGGRAGEMRQISAASISGIIAQTPIAIFLQSNLESIFLSSSFGYRPRKCARHAVRTVKAAIDSGNIWVFDADIEKFFDSVQHDLLLQSLRRCFPEDELLLTLVHRFLKTGHVKETLKGTPAKHIRSPRGNYQSNQIGLPQGGMLSGTLANLVLHDLDELMSSRFTDLVYVRYADDFVVLAKNREELEKQKKRFKKILVS